MDAKNLLVDADEAIEELIGRILEKSGKMQVPTAGFAAKRYEIAKQMAEHLIKPETISTLRNAHLSKAIGSAERWMREGATITDDINDTLRSGMIAAHSTGETSDMVRLQLVRQYLRKLALAANIFAAQGGRYAEDIFNVLAMQFAKDGRLPPSPETAPGTVLRIIDDGEAKLLRTQLYMFDAKVAPERAQIQAAAGLRYRKPEEIASAERKLTLAQEQFDEVMSRISVIRESSTDQIKLWEAEYKTARQSLDKARKFASERGVQTFHYQAGEWVPSDQYNPEIARQLAEEMEAAYVAGQSGLIARSAVDSVPVVPQYKLLKGKALKDALKRENLLLANARVSKSVKHSEEISATAVKNIGKYDETITEPGVAPMQELQEVNLKELKADMGMPPVVHPPEELIPEIMSLDVQFGPTLKMGDKAAAKSQLWERLSSFRGKADLIALARGEESAGFLRTSNVLRRFTAIEKQYSKVEPLDFAEAMDYAISSGAIPKSVPQAQREIAMALRPIIGVIRESIGDLNKDAIVNALQRFGLDSRVGYIMDEGKLAENMEQLFDALPFVKGKNLQADEELLRQRRMGELADSGLHPIQLLANLIKAVSVTKAEQGLAANIVANFGWKADPRISSYEDAIKAGWVAIESKGTGQASNIINAMPTPKDGALFPPEIAGQIGAVVRHWNELLMKPRNEMVQLVSQFTGLAKVFMTVNRLGYHVLNAASDLSTAMIRGTTPMDMLMGSRITAAYVARTLPAEYGRFTDAVSDITAATKEWVGRLVGNEQFVKETGITSAERQLQLILKSWGPRGEEFLKSDTNRRFAPKLRVVGKNGGVNKLELNEDELLEKMVEKGILEKNVFINAIQGLDDAMILDSRDLQKAKLLQKTGARLTEAAQTFGKVGGDFASIYSNSIRVAHVYKIMRGRVWRNLDEALDFAADEIAIFHPTNKSLGSFERRNSALISSFYTWLRMAHVMVFKMAMENYRELYAINKGLYALNSMDGEPPQSMGTPFSQPEKVADWYRYRVGQVIIPGVTDEGALGIRTPFAWSEVLNSYQFFFDVAASLNENVTGMGRQTAEVIARSGPIAGQLASKFLLGYDPSTGRTVDIKTAGDVAEEFVNLLPALTGPAKGFFGVDLAQETGTLVDRILGTTRLPSQQKEVTPDKALLARLNNLLGVAAFQPESKASKRRADFLRRQERKVQLEKSRLERRKEMGLD